MGKFGETYINGRKVGTIQLDGETWYKGIDVCGAAGHGDWQYLRETKVSGNDLRLLTHYDDVRIKHSTYYINEHALHSLIPDTIFGAMNTVEEIVKASGAENETVVLEHPMFGMVRIRVEDEKVLMCASDVAKALGYSKPNDAIHAHCRCAVKRSIPHPQSPSKKITMGFISEGDVYRLIVSSKLPAAEQFEHWLFDEMLPSLRKNGASQVEPQIVDDPIAMFRKAVDMLEEQINKNKELVSQLNDKDHALVAANDEVRRWREQYYKVSGKNEHLQKQIEAYHVENSHRKEFTSFINSCVRSFVGNSYGRYIMPTGWSEYYRRLAEAIGDDVHNRGRQPYIDGITDEELPIAMKVAAQMASGELLSRIMSDTIRNAIAA